MADLPSDMRDGVSSLCHVLVAAKITNAITPQVIQLAEENHRDASQHLWQALHDIKAVIDKRYVTSAADDAWTSTGHEPGTTSFTMRDLKVWVILQGYKTSEFLSIGDTQSGLMEFSRELLLAFSWLICTSGVIGAVVERRINRAAKADSSAASVDQGIKFDVDTERAHLATLHDDAKCRCKYLSWLYSRARHAICSQYAANEQLVRLIERCNDAGVSNSTSTRHHVAQNTPVPATEDSVASVVGENKLLLAYLAWKSNEDHYWRYVDDRVLQRKMDGINLRSGAGGGEVSASVERRRNKMMRSNMRRCILSAREELEGADTSASHSREQPTVGSNSGKCTLDFNKLVEDGAVETNVISTGELRNIPVEFVRVDKLGAASTSRTDHRGRVTDVRKLTSAVVRRRNELVDAVSSSQRECREVLEGVLVERGGGGGSDSGGDIAVIIPAATSGTIQ